MWDARMQAGLCALLSRLLCSRRALEAAWNLAPGITAAAAKRAVTVVPELRPRVHGILASLDKCTCTSMSALLDAVRDAVNAGAARAIAAAEAEAAPAARDAAAPALPSEAAAPLQTTLPPPGVQLPLYLPPAAAPATLVNAGLPVDTQALSAAMLVGATAGAMPLPGFVPSVSMLEAATGSLLGYPAPPELAFAAQMLQRPMPPPPPPPPPSLSASERLQRDAVWLVDTLRVVLRAAEASIAQGKATFPEAITLNREPYVQAEWQTRPFARRPYVRLTDYQIMTDGLGDEAREVAEKLRAGARATGCAGDCCATRKQLGVFRLAAGCFAGECACLNSSHECGPACGCAADGPCMNTNVTARRTLQLGVHVQEQDVWGLDCYARRNVHDAVRDAHLLDDAPEALIASWTERALLPAMNAAGARGWDIKSALRDLHARARAVGDRWSASAAAAIAARVSLVGRVYFRAHPKGCGIVVTAPGGLPAQTMVEEYFGEVHPPWRWFEKQDALKKKRRAGDLPDFYNICLDRPKDDPAGFDVLFVDAAPAGSFASRLSHSCSPNCQAVVISAGGRLTIAVYTLRWIAPGEELTFDYSSVTESDAEYRAAICLCGTARCRGSFLYWAGSSSFQQVMAQKHTFADRNALLLRAGMEPVTDADRARLERCGLRTSALGGGAGGAYRAPEWLVKWAALTCEYIEQERAELPAALCAAREFGYTPEAAAEQARGVAENRLQNLVITLDKVKHVLRQPGQPQTPPLRLLSDAAVAAALWSAPDSVARRLVDTAASYLCSPCRNAGGAAGGHATPGCAALARLQALGEVPAGAEEDRQLAVARLLEMEVVLRGVDTSKPAGGRHAAAADLAHFYASTQYFFTSERYNAVASPVITLREEEVGWVDGSSAAVGRAQSDVHWGMGARSANAAAAAAAAASVAATAARTEPDDAATSGVGTEFEAPENDDDWWVTDARTAVRWTLAGSGGVLPREDESLSEALFAERGGSPPRAPPPPPTEVTSPLGGVPARSLLNAPLEPPSPAAAPPQQQSNPVPLPPDADADDAMADGDEEGAGGNAPRAAGTNGTHGAVRPALLGELQDQKKYRPLFIWGQLTGWFKQTVMDPTASLSADRRGTISLPDVDSCYGRYSLKERAAQLALLVESPGAMWPVGTLWSFKNTQRLYGTPMLDAAIARLRGEPSTLPRVVEELMAHDVKPLAPPAPSGALFAAASGTPSDSGAPSSGEPAMEDALPDAHLETQPGATDDA